ncbi:Serine--tRNA ligase [Brevundimonas subvibrioides]|uniref:serine--tRNA ligase n=1 Tax=Brevundimonas subvibrioides TaxID=74313 RepID=UPI0032D5B13A
MHDIRAIRETPDTFVAGWSARGVEDAQALVAEILSLDTALRAAQTAGQDALARRNATSKLIGAAMGKKDMVEADRLKAEVEGLKAEIAAAEAVEADKGTALRDLLAAQKNLAADDVPDGEDEAGNVEVSVWGEPRRTGPAKDHADLGEALGLLDFEAAARMSGARFAVLKGGLARLERAIGQFMLDLQTTEHGYLEVNPPLLVNDAAAYGTDKLPKFADDLFQTTDGRWLIPTAEVSLTAMAMGQLLPESAVEVPMRLTALTPCFRAEAGSAGRDTRGLIRQHQFYKVELVSITRPEDSDAEHERMAICAETVLKRLELPYRRMLLCKGDMGFGAKKTFDLEVWLPSQGTYREISSVSNCGDFQARRMDARFKRAGGGKPEFVHTLNGSGLAVGRTLVAIMENYQDEGGRIAVPEALVPYMGGLTHVGGA